MGIAAAVLVLVLVLAGGAWLMSRSGDSVSGAATPAGVNDNGTFLAVLPFEHQGDSADAYITEGLSDELRGRLSSVRDLAVIARGSSVQYRGTTKSPREIAEELGVRWLLTATVQVSGSGETRRVIVRPELVEVGADGQPRTRWGEPFDAEGADALRLQGDIAGRVVDAMQVKLAGDDRARTIAVPTTDPAAYDAYLRGREALEWGANQRVAALDRAIPYFEEAVQRDPAFVDAWLGLAMSRVLRFMNGRTSDDALIARATEAMERVERLAPGSPQALLARSYHARGIARDYNAVREVLERGARLAPGDYRFVGNLGYLLLQNLGRSEEAATAFTRATALDPNNGQNRLALAQALIAVGRLPEAKLTADRAVALLPGSASPIYVRVTAELATGDTASARDLLRRLFPTITDQASAFLLGVSIGWLLDAPAATRLLALDASAVGMGRAEWAVGRAALLHGRGDLAGARAWGDTARLLLVTEAASAGAGSLVLQDLAIAEALAGRPDATLAAAVRARDAVRAEREAATGTVYALAIGDLAGALAIAGVRDSAIAWLADPALASVGLRGPLLAADPIFASLRDDPRFRALAAPRPSP
jgi:TolB-like protein/tetratricopeptide (TPR) repeat protein